MTISKSFAPNLDKLHVEFKSKENRTKRHAYRAKCDSTQQSKLTTKWYDFIIEYSTKIPFFEYLDN